MFTCLVKRVLPFMFALIAGLMATAVVGTVTHGGPERFFRREGHAHRSCPHMNKFAAYSTPVIISFKPQPVRTRSATRDGVTGVVELQMTLGRDGSVSEIVPVSELPDGLTEEAVRAAKDIKFSPATVNGEPVDTTQNIKFSFGND
jgi:TonB family protein